MVEQMVVDRERWQPGEIVGRRIVLRRHRAENLAVVSRWYRDPEVARLTRYQTRPMPREEVERFFQTRLLGPDSVAYAIHVRLTDRLIGLTTFSSLDPDNGSVLFHITLGERDVWGQGYGTEAASLMLAHAFERLGLHRVGLSVFSFNERAIRSYE
ncbi:MAG: GNAT family N-acetyltransferase, partial [Chloroflexi bacterium]|nr:GNAT family N-acetyltransferase [Chloroflexota bacterium]